MVYVYSNSVSINDVNVIVTILIVSAGNSMIVSRMIIDPYILSPCIPGKRL